MESRKFIFCDWTKTTISHSTGNWKDRIFNTKTKINLTIIEKFLGLLFTTEWRLFKPLRIKPSQLFTKRQILDLSKPKEFADDNFKFDENGGKFSKWVENTGGKGEIARYKQFLLFPQCFQKTLSADM